MLRVADPRSGARLCEAQHVQSIRMPINRIGMFGTCVPCGIFPGVKTPYVFSVAAGILPAVEPGILPGGMSERFQKTLPLRTAGPGGKMPPSTAAKMAAATDVNPTLKTYNTPGYSQDVPPGQRNAATGFFFLSPLGMCLA